jgi:predicted transcriptional regulator
MIMKIGENAGRVYEYLRGKGKVSFNHIVKGTNLKQKEADRAIGWLAREGKIRIDQGKKEELITLTE